MEEISGPQSGVPTKPTKAYSCIRCFERKVKCDRESPCSNCAKSGIECIFRVPPAPRRRKRKTQEEILKARLTRYEDILSSKGIDFHKVGVRADDMPTATPSTIDQKSSVDSLEGSTSGTPGNGDNVSDRKFVEARLIVDQGRTRFVENNLWTSMAEELYRPSDALPESSDREDTDADDNVGFVIGATPSSIDISELHPLPEQVFTIWQIFVDNVNPLSKIVHVPSLQPTIIEASSHLDKLPRNFEALLFAIYSAAILSLDPAECENMLGESKSVLFRRYCNGTKRALARVKFLGTSDMIVFIAFVLHLLSMRDVYDANTIWTLTGVANRIGEGMGIHRDGTSLGLGPFETEMRRRIWWQLTFLDFRVAELSGLGQVSNLNQWNVQLPSNLNDADIWPGMKQQPVSQERGTEMIFCLTRYELGNFWKQKIISKIPHGDINTLWENFRRSGAIDEKEKGITELERHLEHKYARYCDPSVPVDFMAMLVARAATGGMRLMTHHPRRYQVDEEMPESERKFCWSLAIKLLEMDNLCHSSKQIRRFIWHIDNYFAWQALILILTELRQNPQRDESDRGWQLVNEVFQYHPNFVTDYKRPIHFAVGSLCVKAWKAREDMWSQKSFAMALVKPEYIATMEIDRVRTSTRSAPQPTRVQPEYFGNDPVDKLTTRPSRDVQTFISPQANNLQTNLLKEMQQLNVQHFNAIQANIQQPSLPQQPIFTQPEIQPQQPFFWWDMQEYQHEWSHGFDFNRFPLMDSGPDYMDWSQWDELLK